MFNRLVIALNNAFASFRRSRQAPDHVLILAPHCLQNHECQQDVTSDIANCARCGKCRMADLIALGEEFSARVIVANGGQQAYQAAKASDVRVVIAVACEKELAAGIIALGDKRVIAIRNIIKCDPCRDTDVSIEEVRQALEKVISHDK